MTRRIAGVDVGGTFTDVAIWDGESRNVILHKLLSTPDDPSRGIRDGLGAAGLRPDEIVHATTLVTNAVIERRGVPTGLITTSGYRDVIEIGNELRYDPFDLMLTLPEPLAARHRRLSVDERMGADGVPVVPPDEKQIVDAGRQLLADGVRSIAVAFFNSYRNPAHEQRAVDVLRKLDPSLSVCASAEVAPEIREYGRFSTALANAYIQPIVSKYLLELAETLEVPLFVMLSDGGITTARIAARNPINLLESGPAAGTMGAAHLASVAGWPDVIAFDMGGTTAKISLVHGGSPEIGHELEVARVERFKKASGLPVRIPVIELIEIGAGGGSIAWIDDLGLLKVGPRSAGASPGPACYALGGTEPTVTDADLYLGYLDPGRFCGGRMSLDVSMSRVALEGLASRLRIEDTTTVAAGLVEVVNNNMASAARVHVAEKGHDPRRYRMIAFGGAGPVHAYAIARLLHVPEVVFPRGAGVASAIGMLVAPRSIELTRSLLFPLDKPLWHELDGVIADLRQEAVKLLAEAGVTEDEIRFQVSAEIRYAGQGYEVNVPIATEIVDQRDAAALVHAFRAEYERRFGRSLDMRAEVVSWRFRATADAAVSDFRLVTNETTKSGSAKTGMRPVYFIEADGFVSTAVYERALLEVGDRIFGPAIIEEAESTVVVGPSGRVTVDTEHNLVMSIDYSDVPRC